MLLKLHVYFADIHYFNHYYFKLNVESHPCLRTIFITSVKNLKGQHLPKKWHQHQAKTF